VYNDIFDENKLPGVAYAPVHFSDVKSSGFIKSLHLRHSQNMLINAAKKQPFIVLRSIIGGDVVMVASTLLLSVVVPNSFLTLCTTIFPVNDVIRLLASIAPLTSIFLYVCPITALQSAFHAGNANNYPTPVFQAQIVCNVLALAYGLVVHNIAIIVPNLFGLFCQVVWLSYGHAIFSHANQTNINWFVFLFMYIIMLNVGLACCTALPITVLGSVITICNLILYASPLTKVVQILATRDGSLLNVPITSMMTISNAVWSGYSMLIQDQVLFLPSFFGYLLNVFQVILILWCHHKLPYELDFLLWLVLGSKKKNLSKEAV